MDRRSLLKTLGIGLSMGCSSMSHADVEQSLPVITAPNVPSPFSQIVKIITVGRHCASLVDSLKVDFDYFGQWTNSEFIAIQEKSEPSISHARVIRSPVEFSAFPDNRAAVAKKWAWEVREEITATLASADIVVLVVTLDSDLAFGACDVLARIARNTGALTIAIVGTPLADISGSVETYEDQLSYDFLSTAAVYRIMNEADCVYTDEGYWEGKFDEEYVDDETIKTTIDHDSWCFLNSHDLISRMIRSASLPLAYGVEFNLFRSTFLQSGILAYGYGIDDIAVGNQSVERALGNGRNSYVWGCLENRIHTAAAGIVVVTSHPRSVDDALAMVKATMQRNAPLKRSGKPYWREKASIIFQANPDKKCDLFPGDGRMKVEIISTDIISIYRT